MTQYLLSVHNDGNSPYASDEDMQRAYADTGKFNEELQASGKWVFAGGLMPAATAKVVRVKDGALDRTDGPYLESKEHIGGFWIVDVADEAEALGLAERGAVVCGGDVEVHPSRAEREVDPLPCPTYPRNAPYRRCPTPPTCPSVPR